MRCGCSAGFCTARHDIYSESGWGACDHKYRHASTREPTDTDLQGVSFLDPALVNGRHVDFDLMA